MNPKTILTEDGWDEVAPDCKGKDKELRRALLFYWSLEDDDFDFRCKALGKIGGLAGALKTANEVKGDRDAVKHLTDVISASKEKQNELTKAKAEAEKALKTKAPADKKAGAEAKEQEKEEQEAAQNGADEDEDEAEDSAQKLKRLLQSLKTSKVPYYFIACDAKPYGLVVAKKNIKSSAQHKKELARVAGGNTRPPKFGTCVREGNKLIFEMEKPAPGLARVLQKWLKVNIGIPFKVMVGSESAEDEEGAGQPEKKPANEERPPPLPALAQAPDVWHQARRNIETGIGQLKAAVRKEFAEEGKDLIAEIDGNMQKLDRIVGTLDQKLAESLANAQAADTAATRKSELQRAKMLVAEHIKYIKAEPLIGHIDSNPFGVKVDLKKTLSESLAKIAKAIGV